VQDIYWTYSNSPIYGSRGEITGILSVCHDMTREILAGRERDAFSERLEQVLDATTDAVVCLTRDWRISYMNPRAQEIAAPGGRLLGANLWRVIPKADYPGSPLREHLRRAMYEGKSGEFESYYPETLAAVGRLAASIAHEMNNPLEALTNLLYLAIESKDERLVRRYLEDAERE